MNRRITSAMVITALIRAEQETSRVAMIEAMMLSQGTFSTDRLSGPPPPGATTRYKIAPYPYGLNHPYGLGEENARGPRGAIPYNDPAKINRQSGLFWSSWIMRDPKVNRQTMLTRVENTAPYASDLALGKPGLRGMISRPLPQRVAKKVEKLRERNIINELKKVVS